MQLTGVVPKMQNGKTVEEKQACQSSIASSQHAKDDNKTGCNTRESGSLPGMTSVQRCTQQNDKERRQEGMLSAVGGQRGLGTQTGDVWQTANALPSKYVVRADSEGGYIEIRKTRKRVDTETKAEEEKCRKEGEEELKPKFCSACLNSGTWSPR